MVSETNQMQPFETKDPGDPGRHCGKVRALGPVVSRPASYDRVAMVFASMVQYHQARFGDQQAAAGDEKRNEASRGCSSGSRWKTRDEEEMKLTDIANPEQFQKVVDCQWAFQGDT